MTCVSETQCEVSANISTPWKLFWLFIRARWLGMSSPVPSSSSPGGSPGLAPPCGQSDPSLETCSETSFVDDLLHGFRLHLQSLKVLAPLSGKMEAAAALPQRAILNALRSLVDPITVAILLDDDHEAAADALLRTLASENEIDLTSLTQEERSKCARWLSVIGSYFADMEIS